MNKYRNTGIFTNTEIDLVDNVFSSETKITQPVSKLPKVRIDLATGETVIEWCDHTFRTHDKPIIITTGGLSGYIIFHANAKDIPPGMTQVLIKWEKI